MTVFFNHTKASFVARKCAVLAADAWCVVLLYVPPRGCSGSQRCDSAAAFATHGKFRNFTIAQTARNDSSYRANSGCPRFPDLCDRKSVKRSRFFPLSRDEISRAERRACTIVRLTCGQFYIFAGLVFKRLPMWSFTNWVIRSKFIIDSFYIKSCKLFKKCFVKKFFIFKYNIF